MNLDFSFIGEYLPYYFDGVKYTLIISLITVLFGAFFGSVLFLHEIFKFSHLEDKTFKNTSSYLY